MSKALPFLVIVMADKRTGTKRDRRKFASATEAEAEAARLRAMGWSAYANRARDFDARQCWGKP